MRANPEVVSKVYAAMRNLRDLSLSDIIEVVKCDEVEVWRAVEQLQSEGKVYFDWEPDRLANGRAGRKQWHLIESEEK